MERSNLATWKYEHEGTGVRSRRRYITAAMLFLAALPAFWKLPPLGFILLAISGFIFFGSTKSIRLGPRYLICGNAIVYYGNVKRITLDQAEGRLLLFSASGSTLALERIRFPTNARKNDKIIKNRRAKFDKVSGKIIESIRAASPGVEIQELPARDPSNA